MTNSAPPISKDELNKRIAAIRQRYAKNLPERLREINTLAHHSTDNPSEAINSWQRMIHIAHKLAGSGATFGFPLVSEYASELESYLTEILNNPALASAEQSQIRAKISELTNKLNAAANPSR